MDKRTIRLKNLSLLLAFSLMLMLVSTSESTDVVVVGDAKLKPVTDVVDTLRQLSSYSIVVKTPGEIGGNLADVVTREGAKAVIALGTDAVTLSLSLPESIPVVYGLVIKPLDTKRRNITGIYMATPLEKYLSVIEQYFPQIAKVGLIYEKDGLKTVSATPTSLYLAVRYAGNPYEFLETVKKLDRSVDALLLMPEKNLITSSSLQRVYLFSFIEKVPLLGISEKHVKDGSLMCVVFDIEDMGRQLGELTNRVFANGSANGVPQVAPEKYKIYINRQTAESMGIPIEPELLRVAERVYP